VARDVQQLVEQTSVVELNLLNTLNSLQVLSATQFIENVSRGKMLRVSCWCFSGFVVQLCPQTPWLQVLLLLCSEQLQILVL